MKLNGVFPPITTPFTPDGSVALDRLRDNVAKYNGTGIAGYVVIGSTGESVLLSADEIDRILAAVREAAAPGKLLIAGTGVDSTAETIRRTNRAAELGYHVALVKTPYYYKPQMTPDAEIEHYQRVAEAAKIPVLVYVVPQFTGVALEAATVAQIAKHPNIAGIKESSGNVQRVAEIIASVPAGFQTLVGSASTFYPSLAMGAVGGILGVADFLPEQCVELYRAAQAGDMPRAAQLQQQLLPAGATIVARHGVAGTKYAMDRVDYSGGNPRAPLRPLGDSARKEVEAVLAAFAPAAARA